MTVLDLSPGFAYRGEGNANLVISVPNSRIVLRFPKSKFSDKSQAEKLDVIVRYVNLVMRPMLPQYVDLVSIGRLDWTQFQQMKEVVSECRPADRIAKNIFYPAALVMPDYALLPPQGARRGSDTLLTVEIKPKLGQAAVGKGGRGDQGLCNFCLKQHFKLTSGVVTSLSQYCPLDLFSGDTARMIRAVRSLIAAPQNNLRLLANGSVLHGSDSIHSPATHDVLDRLLGSEQVLAPVLVTCLTHQPGLAPRDLTSSSVLPQTGPGKTGMERTKCHGPVIQLLPNNCILGSVLRLQKFSQISDPEAAKLLQTLLDEGQDLDRLQELVSSPETVPLEERVKLLRDYLITVTAKDLSLILTLAEATGEGNPGGDCLRIRDKWICFKWSIVDLDPKSLNRIPKYVEEKQKWLKTFQQRMSL